MQSLYNNWDARKKRLELASEVCKWSNLALVVPIAFTSTASTTASQWLIMLSTTLTYLEARVTTHISVGNLAQLYGTSTTAKAFVEKLQASYHPLHIPPLHSPAFIQASPFLGFLLAVLFNLAPFISVRIGFMGFLEECHSTDKLFTKRLLDNNDEMAQKNKLAMGIMFGLGGLLSFGYFIVNAMTIHHVNTPRRPRLLRELDNTLLGWLVLLSAPVLLVSMMGITFVVNGLLNLSEVANNSTLPQGGIFNATEPELKEMMLSARSSTAPLFALFYGLTGLAVLWHVCANNQVRYIALSKISDVLYFGALGLFCLQGTNTSLISKGTYEISSGAVVCCMLIFRFLVNGALDHKAVLLTENTTIGHIPERPQVMRNVSARVLRIR